jgi:hypothetical protein
MEVITPPYLSSPAFSLFSDTSRMIILAAKRL